MKKKTLCTIMISAIATALIGCSSGEPSVSQNDALSEEEIQSMIDDAISDNNEELKSEILSQVDKSIETELAKIDTMSDEEKEELRKSILASAKNEIGTSTTTREIVNQPINEYYNTYTPQEGDTYTTKEGDTYITEENVTNVVQPEEPPKIEDGTAIPVTAELPISYELNDTYTLVVESISVTASNHETEPYVEIEYPYHLDVLVSGSVEYHPSGSGMDSGMGISRFPLPLILQPYGTEVYLGGIELSPDSDTFSITNQISVNTIPESVSM